MNGIFDIMICRFLCLTGRVLLGIVAMLVATGCADSFSVFDGNASSDGEYKTATFEIEISPSVAAERTRANDDGEEVLAWDDTTVKEVWIGVFTEDGKLIGSEDWKIGDAYQKPSQGTEHAPMVKEPVRVSVMYPDANPPKVKVVGVANFTGIDAYKIYRDEEGVWKEDRGKMEDLLGKVKTWNDYIAIAFDTNSAECMATRNKCRIMSNIMTPAPLNHYNFLVNSDGVISDEDNAFKKTGTDHYLFKDLTEFSKKPIKGYLHLRRVIAHNTVKITSGSDIELRNIRYKVFNVPKRTYVQDRAGADTFGDTYGKSEMTQWQDWFAKSPNAADWFDETQLEDAVARASYYDVDGFEPFDGTMVKKMDDGSYQFEFSHYDNKHWGLKGGVCEDYSAREVKFDGSDVYKSLCPTEDQWFNNYATYFQISATVTDTKLNLTADVDYIIHEGGANDVTYVKLTEEPWVGKRSRDFMCVRNTAYTYQVQINGLQSIDVGVLIENSKPNAAVSGKITSIEHEVPAELDGKKEMVLKLTNDQWKSLVWRIYEPAVEDGEVLKDYGTFSQNEDKYPGSVEYMKQSYDDVWRNTNSYKRITSADEVLNDEFYKAIKFYKDGHNGLPIHEFVSSLQSLGDNDELIEYKVEFNASYRAQTKALTEAAREDMARVFYCYPTESALDGKYQPLFVIKQYPKDAEITAKLGQPTITSPFVFGNSGLTSTAVAIADFINSMNVAWTESVSNEDSNVKADQYNVSIINASNDVVYTYTHTLQANLLEATLNLSSVTSKLVAGEYQLRVVASRSDGTVNPSEPTTTPFTIYPGKYEWDLSGVKSAFPNGTTKAEIDYNFNGLHIITDNNTIKGTDSKYGNYTFGIDMGGGGSTTKRTFKFNVPYAGKLTVIASCPNGDRYVQIITSSGTIKSEQPVGKTSATTVKEDIFTVTDAPDDVYVHSAGSGIVFYYLKYEPM